MEVSQAEQARKGDVFDFHYIASGWCKQAKIESLVHKLDQDMRWRVDEFQYDEETGKLRIRVEVLENPFPVIIIVAAIGAIGAGLLAWLSLDKIEKITTHPVAGLTALAAVIGGLLILRKAL